MTLMGILLVVLIVVLALATFIESGYGTETAWAVVYGTHWFELLLILIGLNITGSIIVNKTYRRSKITVFVFHLAFVVILIGAGITRFISYEGLMHIREGATSSVMISDDAYIKVDLRVGDQTATDIKKSSLSTLSPKKYRTKLRIGGETVKIKATGFIANAVEQYIPVPGGEPFVQLVAVTDQRIPVGIPSGETRSIFGMNVSLNSNDTTALFRLFSKGENLFGYVPFKVSAVTMGGGAPVDYEPFDTIKFESGTVYSFGHMRFALQRFMPSAKMQLVQAQQDNGMNLPSAVRLQIKYRGMTSEQYISGYARAAMVPFSGRMGDLNYTFYYGSRDIKLPFSLKLKDFQIDRYPGSNSPSSFASEVTLIDPEQGIQEDHRIFMNNVLKHRGFRFYQSSYDTDEHGTILSVNKDSMGTSVTYIGYFILMMGMFLALFNRGTRFSNLARKSSGMKAKAGAVLLMIMVGSSALFGQSIVPPKDVAAEFGELWVQGNDGRFEPINTLSGEVVRKITGKPKFESYTADQVLLGMVLYPEAWQAQPLFRVKNQELQRMLGYRGEYVSFNTFVDTIRGYVLSDLVNAAYSKEVAMRTDLDKQVIKLDDRINAMYMVQSGGLLRIFPGQNVENHKWHSVSDVLGGRAEEADSLGQDFLHYLDNIQHGNYGEASRRLAYISNFQSRFSEILPGTTSKRIEILYNRSNIFPRLSKFYGLIGLILVVLQFIRTFRRSKLANYLFIGGVILLAVGFCFHTLAFFARWYVSGHAPMSNGYESMIFVSWVTLLAGLIFTRRSGFASALTAILASLALIVANMSWMNPEITNLVPVLKSVWLTIHVTVVMAGYGFLGLASLMGLITLVFYAIINGKNKARISEVIDQIVTVNHLTMTIGLYFMTAGVFLGGVWANESWGRYWGWDPKETWALITVLVYAFVSHMNRIPGMRGNFAFSLAAFWGYSSVMMTYFGVNYFLGGIHSYAGGSPFAFPWYSYAIVVILLILSVFSYFRFTSYFDAEVKKTK